MATLKYKAKTENGEEWLPIGVKILGEVGGGKKYWHTITITDDSGTLPSTYLITLPSSNATKITTKEALYNAITAMGGLYPASGVSCYETDESLGVVCYVQAKEGTKGVEVNFIYLWGALLKYAGLSEKYAVITDNVVEF